MTEAKPHFVRVKYAREKTEVLHLDHVTEFEISKCFWLNITLQKERWLLQELPQL